MGLMELVRTRIKIPLITLAAISSGCPTMPMCARFDSFAPVANTFPTYEVRGVNDLDRNPPSLTTIGGTIQVPQGYVKNACFTVSFTLSLEDAIPMKF